MKLSSFSLFKKVTKLSVFQFINDLEKDRQYWGWPSDLQEVSFCCCFSSFSKQIDLLTVINFVSWSQILRPTFPGMMRYIAKNIFNLVKFLLLTLSYLFVVVFFFLLQPKAGLSDALCSCWKKNWFLKSTLHLLTKDVYLKNPCGRFILATFPFFPRFSLLTQWTPRALSCSRLLMNFFTIHFQ